MVVVVEEEETCQVAGSVQADGADAPSRQARVVEHWGGCVAHMIGSKEGGGEASSRLQYHPISIARCRPAGECK